MTDSIFQKYIQDSRSPLTERERSLILDDADNLENCGYFGWLRGVKERSVMLEFRKADGNIRAVAYSWVESFDFDPSTGISVQVAGKLIQIRGRHLNAEIRSAVQLFDGLVRHRVPWVREATRQERMEAPEHTMLIDGIDW